jgi:hypothetical protein
MAMGHLCNQALTCGATTVQARHVCLRPGLVDKDQPGGINLALQALPYLTPPGNIAAVLLTGVKSFF